MARPGKPAPPRLARWLFSALAPSPGREFVLGDIDEEYCGAIRPGRSAPGAHLWYWRNSIGSLRELRRQARAERRTPEIVLPESPRAPRMTIDRTVQNLRFALRSWMSEPGFVAVAVTALALGIGANAAIFSVVYGVLLQPLPYPSPERLMTVWLDNRLQGWHQDVTSFPNFENWRDWNETFAGMAAISPQTDNLTGLDEPLRLRGQVVSPEFFDVLGVAAAVGRTFAPTDWSTDERVVVLSDGLWEELFGRERSVLGTAITLNGTPHTVIGVMPPGFYYLDENARHWRMFPTSVLETSRGQLWLEAVGRLEEGVTLNRARADMDRVGARLAEEFPEVNEGYGVNVVPLYEEVVGDVRPALLVLLGAVGLVLLISCANVANLLLARATSRRRETAIRSALGAGKRRLVGQALTESLMLSLAGGVAGLLVAFGGLRLLRLLQPDVPRFGEIGMQLPVLAFALCVSLATGVVFGVFPALRAARPDFADVLGERGTGEGAGAGRMRGALVVLEVALAAVLLVGAGLLLRSYAAILDVGPGFDPSGVLTFSVSLSGVAYQDADDRRAYYEAVLDGLERLPGVESAAGVFNLPMGAGVSSGTFTIEGQAPVPRAQRQEVRMNVVTPGFFETMRVPVLHGRAFTAADNRDGEPAIVVNETFAGRFLEGEDIVGRRFLYGSPAGYASPDDPNPELPWRRIVGVVGDVRQQALDRAIEPEIFAALDQVPLAGLDFVLRSVGEPRSIAAAARSAVWAVDPDMPIARMQAMTEVLGNTTSTRRFNATLLALFAGLAATLAATGIYGVIAYSVSRQTRDIGVRMALGAQSGNVMGMIARRTAMIVGLGITLGTLGAIATTRLMSSLLFGVSTTDPGTFLGVAALLAAIAAIATFVPARRAITVDPVEALRE